MSATIQKEEGRIWQSRVGEVMKKAKLDSAPATARQEIAAETKIGKKRTQSNHER